MKRLTEQERKSKGKAAKVPSGYILYEGKSLLGGGDIVCIAVLHSENEKTDDMVQVYIIPKDESPLDALKNGRNRGACGTCWLQGWYDENGKAHDRVCYVNMGHGPRVVYAAYSKGAYPKYNRKLNECMLKGRRIRIGAYGDPAALPLNIVTYLAEISDGWTGYSHQMFWVDHAEQLSPYLMVSCHTPAQHAEARRRGWRSFVAIPEGAPKPVNAVECPYYTHGVKCHDCLLCKGTSKKAKDVYVIAHAKVGVNLPKVIAAQGEIL